ncbi:hypothetical protein Ndes2437B_g09125 [Nannochloris sp. 'desiccata']
MFSSIFGNGTSRNLTASLGAGSATASSFSLDTVVTDIATAHAPCSTLALSTASQFLEDKLRGNSTSRNNNRLRTEFAALEALQAKHYNTRYDYTVAVAATEMELNRYVDVLPYEHTRIKLVNTLNSTATSPTIGSPSGSSSFRALLRRKNSGSKVQVVKEQLATYINASSITCSLDPLLPPRGVESHTMNPSWRYIVAQGPLSSTCSTFWEMIVQEKVQSVVMLTDIIENKRKKCHQYFPLNAETTLEIAPEIMEYRNQLLHCFYYPTCCARAVVVGGSGNESPIAVHCSAGIGRSGVFCVVDIAARRLVGAASSVAARRGIETAGGGDPASSSSAAVVLAAQKAVNVGEIVAELRTQRAGMVQTTEQFVFCHAALLELTRAAVAKIS